MVFRPLFASYHSKQVPQMHYLQYYHEQLLFHSYEINHLGENSEIVYGHCRSRSSEALILRLNNSPKYNHIKLSYE